MAAGDAPLRPHQLRQFSHSVYSVYDVRARLLVPGDVAVPRPAEEHIQRLQPPANAQYGLLRRGKGGDDPPLVLRQRVLHDVAAAGQYQSAAGRVRLAGHLRRQSHGVQRVQVVYIIQSIVPQQYPRIHGHPPSS